MVWFKVDPEHLAADDLEWAERIQEFGDSCARQAVPLQGDLVVSFRIPFAWSQDWTVGFLFPRTYSPAITLVDGTSWGDCRLVWECARLQWCVTLLVAARVHGDRSWAVLARDAMNDFLNQNPLRRGIHWASAMETALRLISWMQADALLAERWPELRDSTFCTGIPLHAAELARTLTTFWEVPNNHLLVEASALATVGLLYDDLPGARGWRRTAIEVLTTQLGRQTHDDGVHREMSPGYQRFIMEAVFLWHVAATGRGQESQVAGWLLSSLGALAGLRPPDGRWPMISDYDGGRVFRWDPGASLWNFDAILYAVAAALGQEASDKWRRPAEGVLLAGRPSRNGCLAGAWTGGSSGLRVHQTGKAWLLVRGGDLGIGGEGFAGHAHADLGSLHLWVDGVPFLEDSGTAGYREVDEGWLPFRRSEAHNVVQVGNHEQFSPESTFHNRRLWKCRWRCRSEKQGSLEIMPPDEHFSWRRTYVLDDRGLQVTDAVEGTRCETRLFLPLGRGWRELREHGGWTLVHPAAGMVRLLADVPGRFDDAPVHPHYGATCLRRRWTACFRGQISWSIAWD